MSYFCVWILIIGDMHSLIGESKDQRFILFTEIHIVNTRFVKYKCKTSLGQDNETGHTVK